MEKQDHWSGGLQGTLPWDLSATSFHSLTQERHPMLGSQLCQLILPGEFLLAPPLFWNPFPATWNGNLSTSHLRGGAVPDHPPQENPQAPDITSFWLFLQKKAHGPANRCQRPWCWWGMGHGDDELQKKRGSSHELSERLKKATKRHG